MHRIDSSGATVGHLFQDTAGPTTQVDAAWANDVQENICVLIEYAGITLVKGTYTQLRDAVNGLIAAAVAGAATPPGMDGYYNGPTAPGGWLTRDGSSLSTVTYPALFAILGYLFGGSGASFSLPDDRGEYSRGLDLGRGVDAGRALGSWQAGAYPAHTHPSGLQVTSGSPPPSPYATTTTDITGTPTSTVHTDANTPTKQVVTGSSGGAENIVRNRAKLPVIKY